MRLLGAPGYEMREHPSVANLRRVAISEATRGRVGPGSRLCVTAEHDAAGPGRLRQRAPVASDDQDRLIVPALRSVAAPSGGNHANRFENDREVTQEAPLLDVTTIERYPSCVIDIVTTADLPGPG